MQRSLLYKINFVINMSKETRASRAYPPTAEGENANEIQARRACEKANEIRIRMRIIKGQPFRGIKTSSVQAIAPLPLSPRRSLAKRKDACAYGAGEREKFPIPSITSSGIPVPQTSPTLESGIRYTHTRA